MKKILFLMLSIVSAHLFGQYNYESSGNCWAPCWYERLEIGAEWLHWKSEQGQLVIAADVSGTVVDGVENIVSDPLSPNFSYANGYRIYINYDLSPTWMFSVAVTHMPSSAGFAVFNDPESVATDNIAFNSISFPFLLSVTSNPAVQFSSGESQWDLDLYYLDINIGRTFVPCSWLSISPYAGVRGYWLKEELFISGTSPSLEGSAFFTEQTEKLYGAGIQAGVYGNWQLGYGFSLIGQFGGSLLYSHVKGEGDLSGEAVGVEVLRVSYDEISHRSLPTVDSLIALQYATCICNMFTELHIGWENHLFFSVNDFSLTADGNLSMQGLTLGGSIRF